MERRNFLGAALAACSVPAAADVVCLPVQVPSRKGGLIVSYPQNPWGVYAHVTFGGNEEIQTACIMAQEGENGFIVCYDMSNQPSPMGDKLVVSHGKVKISIQEDAPQWAHDALAYARKNWI